MKLLLDTHIWLKALGRPDSLSREIRRRLERPSNELLLSPVSIWEAANLAKRGRIITPPSFPEWLGNALLQLPVQEVPIDFSVVKEASRIQLDQNDLGDLFLAATASVFDLTLVTEDQQLLSCEWLKTLG